MTPLRLHRRNLNQSFAHCVLRVSDTLSQRRRGWQFVFRSSQMTNSNPPATRSFGYFLIVAFFVANSCTWFTAQLSADEPHKLARDKVAEGLKQYSTGNYSDAASAFSQAADAEPENVIIKFDQACALMAAGENDQARELLLQTALSKDTKLASTAYYNLACIASKQGRAVLGDKPLEAKPEVREQAIERFRAADAHFRDCLRIDSTNTDARHNLELLRSFLNQLQQQWKMLDHQQQLSQMDLPRLLQHLDEQQAQRRQSVRLMQSRPGGSVPKFERQKQSVKQLELSQDISAVKVRIQEQLGKTSTASTPSSPPAAAVGKTPNNDQDESQQQQILEALNKVTEQTGQAMNRAASDIVAGNWNAALEQQQLARDKLRQIYALLAEFPMLLQRAIDEQESALKLSQQPEGKADGDSTGSAVDPKAQNTNVDSSVAGQVWQQNWITTFCNALNMKAQATLQTLPESESTGEQTSERNENEAPSPVPLEDDQKPASVETEAKEDSTTSTNPVDDEKAQLEQFRRALQRTIELAPEILERSDRASQQLTEHNLLAAHTDQLRVLELLKEIAALLPKQKPQQQDNKPEDQNQGDNQQQDQDQQQKQDQQQNNKQSDSSKDNQGKSESNSADNKQQDANKDDSQPNDSSEKKPEEKSADKQPEDSTKGEEKKDDVKQQAENSSQNTAAAKEDQVSEADSTKEQQAKQLAQQRAQAILGRTREREAKYRELLQQLRELQGKRAPVEKDW